jgi:hypothetical protein
MHGSRIIIVALCIALKRWTASTCWRSASLLLESPPNLGALTMGFATERVRLRPLVIGSMFASFVGAGVFGLGFPDLVHPGGCDRGLFLSTRAWSACIRGDDAAPVAVGRGSQRCQRE